MSHAGRMSRLALLAAIVMFVVCVPAAQAGPRVFVGIGVGVPVAPVVVAPAYVPPPPPVYGMVWRPGYYSWTGYSYAWVPGVWVRPPFAGAVWVGPQWVRHPRGAFWAQGYWRR